MRHNQFLKNRHPATYCGEGAPLSRAWNALDQIKRALGLGPAATYQQTAEAVLKVVADLAQTRRSLDNKEHEARALERLHCIAVEQRDALQAIVDDIQAVLGDWSQERIRMLMEARDEALKMPLHGAAPLPPDPIEVLRPRGWSGHVQ